MTRTALSMTKRHFSDLVMKVRSAMEENKVKTLNIREFLLNFFEGDCNIPEVDNLRKIFESLSTAKLWNYEHYDPLEQLTESFLPEDNPARVHMTEYVCRLTAFSATTKIMDYIKVSQIEDAEEDNQQFCLKKSNTFYRKLGVKLKVNNLSELTLKFVYDIWKALQRKFDLPSLTAVIDHISEGSLCITWLILPHIVNRIKASLYKSLDFIQQHNIICIDLYGGRVTLYDEKWMVSIISSY